MGVTSGSGESASPVPQKFFAFSLYLRCDGVSEERVAIVNKHSAARGLRPPTPGEVQNLATGNLFLEFDHSMSADAFEHVIEEKDVLGAWVTETGSDVVYKARLIQVARLRDGGTTQYKVEIERPDGRYVGLGQKPGHKVLTLTIMFRQ